MRTPADKTIAFTFASHPVRDPSRRWMMKLTFPPGAEAATVLEISVTDGAGTPVAEGELEFAGRRLAVRDGAASITYGVFVRGKHETGLWLHRPGLETLPGGLTFG